MKKTLVVLALTTFGMATAAPVLAADLKPADAIKYRQSGYAFMGWNMGRIKTNLDGNYNKDEVAKAATAIAAIANSGMGALYAPGSDKGKGWEATRAKANIFTDGENVGKIARTLVAESTELAKVANAGDAAAVKAQFGKVAAACKACHDDYRTKD